MPAPAHYYSKSWTESAGICIRSQQLAVHSALSLAFVNTLTPACMCRQRLISLSGCQLLHLTSTHARYLKHYWRDGSLNYDSNCVLCLCRIWHTGIGCLKELKYLYLGCVQHQDSLAHLAVPYGGRQDARLEPKYIPSRLLQNTKTVTFQTVDC
jgi:hypothetical protein